jgi:hypothetical protein
VPDPGLLAEAADELAKDHIGGRGSDVRWQIVQRWQRPRSTVLLLRASAAGGSVHVYYKQERPGRGLPVEFVRAGLARSRELTFRLDSASTPHGIRPAPVLAVDPERLASVTLGLDGHPVSGSPWRLLSPAGRRLQVECYRRAGRAIRLIEDVAPAPSEEIHDPRWIWPEAVERSGAYLTDGQVRQLRATLDDLVEEMVAGDDVVYSHGDMSPSNILIADDHIGVIDISWTPRYRGFDMAVMSYRLEYLGGLPTLATSALVDALIDGYGDPDIRRTAAWRYYRLVRHLGLAARGKGLRQAWRARRASASVRNALDAPA